MDTRRGGYTDDGLTTIATLAVAGVTPILPILELLLEFVLRLGVNRQGFVFGGVGAELLEEFEAIILQCFGFFTRELFARPLQPSPRGDQDAFRCSQYP